MDMTDLLNLLLAHKWIPAAALAIGFVVRVLKSDTVLPFQIPARARVWAAFGFGIVAGVLDKVASGDTWQNAIVGGLLAGVTSVTGHELIVESLRGGKEMRVPLLTKGAGSPLNAATSLVLIVALLSSPSSLGCASFSSVLGYVVTASADANALLGYAKSLVDAYYAANPNPADQAKADKGIADAELALDTAEAALSGVGDASQAQVAAAFASFVQAWADLEKLLGDLGVAVPSLNLPTMKAARAGAPRLPVPIVVARARAQGGSK